MRLQQKTALQKVGLLVRAGMMEPPKWYAAAKQVPPFQRRPSNGVEQLKLPWDALANEFTNRNPDMVEDPEWLGPNGYKPGAAPISHVFAKRQYALMQNGLKKEEAYQRTHSAMQKERAADVAAVRRMVMEASKLSGSRPSFVSDDDVYSGLRFWQTMMQETPYSDWDLAAVQGLDVFLRREVIGWDDDQLKFAQSARDGTAAALQAEVNRLRVNLFPETKTVEYTYPSDVVRPANEKEEGGHGDSTEGQEEEGGAGARAEGAGVEEWKSAILNCGWKTTLRRFEEMTEEVSHEMDWSREDRRHLDNFIVARCVRRYVLEEAFGWAPDPVADALAKMNAEMGMGTPPDGSAATASAAEDDGDDGYGDGPSPDTAADAALAGADADAAPAGADADADGAAVASASDDGGAPAADGTVASTEGSADTVSESEGWLTGRSLQEFKGDWMALARMRTGRPAVAGGGRRQPRRRRDGRDGGLMERPSPALEANLRAVITQAKRQLLPDLVLEVDEKSGGPSAQERKARDAAKKKLVMADLEWEREELDVERNAMIEKLKEGMGPGELDPIAEVRKKRLAKGTWKAERRRLLALEKKLYNEQRTSMFYEEEQPLRETPYLPDELIEGEVVKRKANEFYAKEKARMKRNAKLQADAVAAGEEARLSGGGSAAKKDWEPLTRNT